MTTSVISRLPRDSRLGYNMHHLVAHPKHSSVDRASAVYSI